LPAQKLRQRQTKKLRQMRTKKLRPTGPRQTKKLLCLQQAVLQSCDQARQQHVRPNQASWPHQHQEQGTSRLEQGTSRLQSPLPRKGIA
jgi:hypothetical protein